MIEKNQLTDKQQLFAIANRLPSEWEACVDLIMKCNMSDYFCLSALGEMSSTHFHALYDFVYQHDIDDEHVMYGLAGIKSIEQWEYIYTLAQPLFLLMKIKDACQK